MTNREICERLLEICYDAMTYRVAEFEQMADEIKDLILDIAFPVEDAEEPEEEGKNDLTPETENERD